MSSLVLGYLVALRGGSWSYDSYYCRAASRFYDHPYNRYYDFGFRVVRVPPISA